MAHHGELIQRFLGHRSNLQPVCIRNRYETILDTVH